jgi:hypothetical protein
MPVKTFGDLTIKMFKAIEKDGESEIDVFELFERWTLDAIGIAGFGKHKPIPDIIRSLISQ